MADYISALTGPEMDAALQDMAEHNSEAWAVGQRNGSAVGASDVTYHNNAAYYADRADGAAARAEAAVPSGTAGAVFFDRAQTLTDAQKIQTLINIGATNTPRRNLIDNAWFLINQRGQSSYATLNAPGLDRWTLINAGPVLWSEDGISAGAGNGFIIRQRFPRKRWESGEYLEASMLLSDGTVYYTRMLADGSLRYFYNSGTRLPFRMRIQSSGLEVQFQILGDNTGEIVRAIKLERNGASTLDPNDAPDYAEELLRCQRYLFVINSRTGTTLSQIGPAIRWSSGGNYRVSFPLPVPLRDTPTVTIDDVSALKLYYQSGTAYACTSLTATNVNTLNFITLTVACASISTAAVVAQFAIQAGHALIVSAEI